MVEHIQPGGKLNDEGSANDKTHKHEADVIVVLGLATLFIFMSTEYIHFQGQIAITHNIKKMKDVKKYIIYER